MRLTVHAERRIEFFKRYFKNLSVEKVLYWASRENNGQDYQTIVVTKSNKFVTLRKPDGEACRGDMLVAVLRCDNGDERITTVLLRGANQKSKEYKL